MRIGTRILLASAAASAVALGTYAYFALTTRSQNLWDEMRRQDEDGAVILRAALEDALAARRMDETRELVERLSRAERILGIVVNDARGRPVVWSGSVERLVGRQQAVVARVLQSGAPWAGAVEGEEPLHVHIVPLEDAEGRRAGAAEIWRDLGYIRSYLRGSAIRIGALAIALLAALVGATALIAHRTVTRRAAALIAAMRRVGALEEVPPIQVAGADELAQIAVEFNSMTARLAAAREALLREGQARLELERKLRQADKLAAVGQIAADLAHEVGTPLNVIDGRARALLERAAVSGGDRAALEAIVGQAERITRIVQRVLTFARRRAPAPQPLDLGELAAETASLLEAQFAARRVSLVVHREPVPSLNGDPDLLRQVVLNLLVNALQASPAGAEVQLRVFSENGAAVLAVADRGPGIAADVRDRLFEPFVTTKPPGEGTGLGLSISAAIVREHGGRIEFDSRAGEGSTFRVVLPLEAARG